jgi:hypothetical protein
MNTLQGDIFIGSDALKSELAIEEACGGVCEGALVGEEAKGRVRPCLATSESGKELK